MKKEKGAQVVWAVIFNGGFGYGLPERLFKSKKKAMKFAACLNDELDTPAYGAYRLEFDTAKK